MSTPLLLVALLPWIGVGAFLAFRLKEPRPLVPLPEPGQDAIPQEDGSPDSALPFVSIIVPARNEARSIERCVTSLAAQRYRRFEILVVDDRSEDGTGELARAIPSGHAESLTVVAGEPLPVGWFGKPWACHVGSRHARGELLLFTDADTWHHPELLGEAVRGLEEDGAALLSLIGRQEMESFPERLVQPHIFVLIGMRYPRLDRPVEGGNPGGAIANGQYVLVRREAYDEIGGHGAVRGEVVEDLRLAQEMVAAGGRLTMRGARERFSTRMYTSLRELVNGWTKNVAVGARQASGRWGWVAIPAIPVFLLTFWIIPPVVLGMGVAGVVGTPVLLWAGIVTGFSTLLWAGIYHRFDAPPVYALLYFAGAGVAFFIVLRSLLRGRRRIEWKGRRYGG